MTTTYTNKNDQISLHSLYSPSEVQKGTPHMDNQLFREINNAMLPNLFLVDFESFSYTWYIFPYVSYFKDYSMNFVVLKFVKFYLAYVHSK